jgi:hypothetical protein
MFNVFFNSCFIFQINRKKKSGFPGLIYGYEIDLVGHLSGGFMGI